MNYTGTSTTLYSIGTATFTCPAGVTAPCPTTGVLKAPLTYQTAVGTNNSGNDQSRAGFTPRQFQVGARFRF